MIKLSAYSLIALFSLFSCSSSTSQVKSTIEKEVVNWSYTTDVEVSDIELIQELTAMDSLLFLNDNIVAMNYQYNKYVKELEAGAYLLAKSKKNLYYGNSTKVNPHYKNECDNRIASMKETSKKINFFIDGLNGKYEPNTSHVFIPYNNLNSKKENEVVAKIYKARVKYMEKISVNEYNNRTGGEHKDVVKYFVISPDELNVTKSLDKFSIPQASQEQFTTFDRYSVDEEGNIKKFSGESSIKSASQVLPEVRFEVKDLKGNNLQKSTHGNNSEIELLMTIDGAQIGSFKEFGQVDIDKDENGNPSAYFASDLSQATISSEIIDTEKIVIRKIIFFDGEERPIWNRTYTKSDDSWIMSKCEGECQ